ncbi:MAG: glutamate--tRNA ligase [Candidatus Kerfeldbacteria bacterium]|nr:glutamate--tRNA ligase [Candidatus Kerfeldbacteria bacterium]
MPKPTVRVRFAPSPTGDPHIGSIWVAVFNRMFAKQHGGVFVLRLEDTDQNRLVPDAVQNIYDALAWYGLTPDEGPEQGGSFGPYVQSQRRELHQRHARQLVEQGSAYYCFCSVARLDQLRAAQLAAKHAPRYDKHCAKLSFDEVQRRLAAHEPTVIRMNLPAAGAVEHDDVIRGRVTFQYDQLDDSVLLKSDGFPTYHLAAVVDDHWMEISHVIRAEEWLPSVPKHLFLHRAFGWQPPQYAHLPQLLGADRKKLSKRHGATSALWFRDQGYLPEAMRNFLVLMGWHPKGDDEVLSEAEILKQFRLGGVNPSGAIFDQTKLDWLNGVYIRQLPLEKLLERVGPFWHIPEGADEAQDQTWLRQALSLVHDRIKRLSEIDDLINFVFTAVWDREAATFDRSLLVPKQGTVEGARAALNWSVDWLAVFSQPWELKALKTAMLEAIAAAGKKNVEVLWPLRVALTLRRASPDVFDLLALLGKSESLRRVTSLAVPGP